MRRSRSSKCRLQLVCQSLRDSWRLYSFAEPERSIRLTRGPAAKINTNGTQPVQRWGNQCSELGLQGAREMTTTSGSVPHGGARPGDAAFCGHTWDRRNALTGPLGVCVPTWSSPAFLAPVLRSARRQLDHCAQATLNEIFARGGAGRAPRVRRRSRRRLSNPERGFSSTPARHAKRPARG